MSGVPWLPIAVANQKGKSSQARATEAIPPAGLCGRCNEHSAGNISRFQASDVSELGTLSLFSL